jgi:SAM-dependent methyltransferase
MENYESHYTDSYLKKKEKGKGYDTKIGSTFELFLWDLEKIFLKEIIEEFFPGKKDEIKYLDFACGTGRIIAYFKNGLGIKNSVGLDTSRPMLDEAKKKTEAQFICGNINEDKSLLVPRYFDVITAFRLFLNLEKENREPVLNELKQYLKDDGLLIINNHINRYSLIGFQFWIRRLLGNTSIIHNATEKEFKEMLNRSGFDVIKVCKFAFFPGRKKIIILPKKYLKRVELFISKIPVIRNLCLSQIYVCRKNA